MGMTHKKIVELIEHKKNSMRTMNNNTLDEAERVRNSDKKLHTALKINAKKYYFCYEELDSILDEIRG